MSSASLVVSPGSPPARWEVRVPGSKSITNRALLLAGVAAGSRPARPADGRRHARRWRRRCATLGVRRDRGADRRRRGRRAGRSKASAAPPTGTDEVYLRDGRDGRALPGADARRRQRAVQRRRAPTAAPPAAGPGAGGAAGAGGSDRRRGVPARDRRRWAVGRRGRGRCLGLEPVPVGTADGGAVRRADTTLRFERSSAAVPGADARTRCGRSVPRRHARRAGTVGRAAPRTGLPSSQIEPDVSTASYFLASAAITGTTVRLPGLSARATAQGDIELVGFLERMGCTVRDRRGAGAHRTRPAARHRASTWATARTCS